MKMLAKAICIITAMLTVLHAVSPACSAVIVDHTCTDIGQIPAYWINQAKAQFRISYGHSSHGSQIVTGMDLLKGEPGSLYWFDEEGTRAGLSFHDCRLPGDLGSSTWDQDTRRLLDAPGNDRNLIMWAWCGQVASATEDDINTYLLKMNQLELDYPNVTFIYMTGHLDGNGESGNLHIRNNQIRDYCKAHHKVLFDFADIESYDPDGKYFLDRWADDGCYYYDTDGQHNWADEWCAAHPGECASCECAHSRCLNCQLKGKAFWWMMAWLAGWGAVPATTTAGETTTTSAPILNCPIVSLYGENAREAQLLRWFRDDVLRKTPEGRELIQLYYLWAPPILRAMEEDKHFKQEVKEIVNNIMLTIERNDNR